MHICSQTNRIIKYTDLALPDTGFLYLLVESSHEYNSNQIIYNCSTIFGSCNINGNDLQGSVKSVEGRQA